MPIYTNSIIYKLCHQDDLENNNIYVGSTTNFRNRKFKHKNNCYNKNCKEYYFPLYKYIRDNGNWNEWKMIPIEVYPCNSKNELEVRERYHIELLKSKLNKKIPTRSVKERYENNKEKIDEYKKQYRQKHKEERAEYDKIYREDNKEKLAEQKKQYYEANKDQLAEKYKKYRKNNKEKIDEYKKQYHQNHKEEKAEYDKIYREANKEIIREKRKEKVICDHCGSQIVKRALNVHQKSKKCINFVKKD